MEVWGGGSAHTSPMSLADELARNPKLIAAAQGGHGAASSPERESRPQEIRKPASRGTSRNSILKSPGGSARDLLARSGSPVTKRVKVEFGGVDERTIEGTKEERQSARQPVPSGVPQYPMMGMPQQGGAVRMPPGMQGGMPGSPHGGLGGYGTQSPRKVMPGGGPQQMGGKPPQAMSPHRSPPPGLHFGPGGGAGAGGGVPPRSPGNAQFQQGNAQAKQRQQQQQQAPQQQQQQQAQFSPLGTPNQRSPGSPPSPRTSTSQGFGHSSPRPGVSPQQSPPGAAQTPSSKGAPNFGLKISPEATPSPPGQQHAARRNSPSPERSTEGGAHGSGRPPLPAMGPNAPNPASSKHTLPQGPPVSTSRIHMHGSFDGASLLMDTKKAPPPQNLSSSFDSSSASYQQRPPLAVDATRTATNAQKGAPPSSAAPSSGRADAGKTSSYGQYVFNPEANVPNLQRAPSDNVLDLISAITSDIDSISNTMKEFDLKNKQRHAQETTTHHHRAPLPHAQQGARAPSPVRGPPPAPGKQGQQKPAQPHRQQLPPRPQHQHPQQQHQQQQQQQQQKQGPPPIRTQCWQTTAQAPPKQNSPRPPQEAFHQAEVPQWQAPPVQKQQRPMAMDPYLMQQQQQRAPERPSPANRFTSNPSQPQPQTQQSNPFTNAVPQQSQQPPLAKAVYTSPSSSFNQGTSSFSNGPPLPQQQGPLQPQHQAPIFSPGTLSQPSPTAAQQNQGYAWGAPQQSPPQQAHFAGGALPPRAPPKPGSAGPQQPPMFANTQQGMYPPPQQPGSGGFQHNMPQQPGSGGFPLGFLAQSTGQGGQRMMQQQPQEQGRINAW